MYLAYQSKLYQLVQAQLQGQQQAQLQAQQQEQQQAQLQVRTDVALGRVFDTPFELDPSLFFTDDTPCPNWSDLEQESVWLRQLQQDQQRDKISKTDKSQSASKDEQLFRLAIISDTHNKLSASTLDLVQGADLILHAGDICDQRILDELELYAPCCAVLGNNDYEPYFFERLRYEVLSSLGLQLNKRKAQSRAAQHFNESFCRFHLYHIARESSPSKSADLIINGHSHVPHLRIKAKARDDKDAADSKDHTRLMGDMQIFVNPGSTTRSRSAFGHSGLRMILSKNPAPFCGDVSDKSFVCLEALSFYRL